MKLVEEAVASGDLVTEVVKEGQKPKIATVDLLAWLKRIAPAAPASAPIASGNKAQIVGRFDPPEGDALIRAQELKARKGRLTITEAIQTLKTEAGEFINISTAVKAGELATYAPGSNKRLVGNGDNVSDDEELLPVELNAWLDANHQHIEFRFPEDSVGDTAEEGGPLDTTVATNREQSEGPAPVTADVIKEVFPMIKWGDKLSKVSKTKYQWLESAVRYAGSPRPGDAKRFSIAAVAACLVLGPKQLSKNNAEAIIKRLPEWLPEWEEQLEYLPDR